MAPIEFRLLGPFEVRRQGRLVADGGGKRQSLLALLLLSANRIVTTDVLTTAMWGEHAPRSATNLVQGYVSYWRNALDPHREHRVSGDRLTSATGGYCLRVAVEECDLLRFRAHAVEGRRAVALDEPYDARRLLRAAISERRGPALAAFDGPVFAEAARAFDDEWLSLVEIAADVELRLGRPGSALALVDIPSEENPLRESLVARRTLALYRSGRQADALETIERTRRELSEELGVDPGPELIRLHLDILHQSPSLHGVPASVRRRPPVLPRRLSSFVGRDVLRDDVSSLLDDHRLVTLTGPAGGGKTRLAVEVAATMWATDDRPVTFVDLAPVRDHALLWSAVAEASGQRSPVSADPVREVAGHLEEVPMLLVLDNMEQLVEAAADIGRLLALAPLVTVLATSREALGVSGEQLVAVPPLVLPDRDDEPEVARARPAVRLFLDRARAADPFFRVTDQDVGVVSDICRRLDGLPLTIELAAPLTTTLTLRALLERLDRPVALLVDHRRGSDQPERHRSLRGALGSSVDGLTPAQRRAFQQLSVFVSGASLDAVETVTGLGAGAVDALAGLRERNLVYRSGDRSAPRFRQLETVRDYAAEQLAADPALFATTLERHTSYIRLLAERLSREARSRTSSDLIGLLRDEQDEVRSVLARFAERGDGPGALSLVTDCLSLWWDLGFTREGYDRLTAALKLAGPDAPDELMAAGSVAAVYLADAVGEHGAALELGAAASRHADKAGSELLAALSLCLHTNTRYWMDPTATSDRLISLLEDAQAMARRAPSIPLPWGWACRPAVLVTTLLVLTDALRHRDARGARRHLDEIVAGDLSSDEYTDSFMLRAAGALDADSGRWESAEKLLTASLAKATRAASLRSQSRSLEELARLEWRRGDLHAASSSAEAATRLARQTGHMLNWLRCLALTTDIALGRGELLRAAALLDSPASSDSEHDQPSVVRMLAPRRARLARLSGEFPQAEQHLADAAGLEEAPGLGPDRVVYLVEAAHAARRRGLTRRTAALVEALTASSAEVGVVLPLPERRYLDQLAGPASAPAQQR